VFIVKVLIKSYPEELIEISLKIVYHVYIEKLEIHFIFLFFSQSIFNVAGAMQLIFCGVFNVEIWPKNHLYCWFDKFHFHARNLFEQHATFLLINLFLIK